MLSASDAEHFKRAQSENRVIVTQDDDFLAGEHGAIVVVSRVRQSRPLAERIAVWRGAVAELVRAPSVDRLFELTDEGFLVPWRAIRSNA